MIMAFAMYLAKCIYSSYQILLYLNHFSLITYTSLRIYALSAPLIFVALRKNQSIQDTQPDQTKPDNCYNFFFLEFKCNRTAPISQKIVYKNTEVLFAAVCSFLFISFLLNCTLNWY